MKSSTNDATHAMAARLRVGNQKRGNGPNECDKGHCSSRHTYENQQSAHMPTAFAGLLQVLEIREVDRGLLSL